MNRLYLKLPVLFVLGWMAAFGQPKQPDTTTAGQFWQQTLTSRVAYPDPYHTVSLTATFTGPGGLSVSVPGFWLSGNRFAFRCAFPVGGGWSWKTACSDTRNKGLHNQTGQVSVAPYSGNNALFRHGFVRVGNTKRYLVYGDGTPFLWLGDTGWMALKKSSLTEWRDYVDNRVAKGFTILQTHATQFVPETAPGKNQSPIRDGQPDSTYFGALEAKLAYATQQGMTVFLTGLGYSGKGNYVPETNTPEFARYLVARLLPYAVILSPSMDAPYDDRNDQMAAHLKRASSIHLITQHVGTVAGAAEAYHGKAHTDFTALQTGHHDGNSLKVYEAAVSWSYRLWQQQLTKPVINSEAMYDGRGNNEGNNWREQDARKLGWMSWLSGAPGYTYGAGETPRHVPGGQGGLFLFVQDSLAFDHWRKVIDWPGSSHMSYLKQFFARIDWWTLEPAPARIRNQASSPLQTMTLAQSPAGDLVVAYLPENYSIQIDMSGLSPGLSGRWFNPVDNVYIPIRAPIANTGEQTFTCPGPGDWVLLLTLN